MDVVRIQQLMRTVSQAFIKAQLSGVCIYASALIKEKMLQEGIVMQLVTGYLQINRGPCYRHAWLEWNGSIYDASIDILRQVDWKSDFVSYTYLTAVPKSAIVYDDPKLEYGLRLYQQDPYQFWSEFDTCDTTDPQIRGLSMVINYLRDTLWDLN
jgi:hypothetical protein